MENKMTKNNANEKVADNSIFVKLRNSIAALVAMLVVIPSVINAGKDIYVSIMNIPVGVSESKNEKLMIDHWDEEALSKYKFKIQNNDVDKILRIRVYKNADIWFKYGVQEQWFSSVPEQTVNRFTLISSAYAEEVVDLKGNPRMLQNADAKTVIVNLNQIHETKNEVTAEDSGVFEKSYLFAKTNNYHSSFSAKKKNYTASYKAEEGYVFSDVKFDVETINHASTPKYKISDDKKTLTVEVSLESGPFYDRWRGWIKATVITTQVKG
jgi:hypothetical protein